MIVTDVTLVAGAAAGQPGALDQINIQDAATGTVLMPDTITWAFAGAAPSRDLVQSPSADGNGFDFSAPASAPTQVVVGTYTWTDPAGVAPSVSNTLNFHITAAAVAAPTAIQADEVVGA